MKCQKEMLTLEEYHDRTQEQVAEKVCPVVEVVEETRIPAPMLLMRRIEALGEVVAGEVVATAS